MHVSALSGSFGQTLHVPYTVFVETIHARRANPQLRTWSTVQRELPGWFKVNREIKTADRLGQLSVAQINQLFVTSPSEDE